jgi:opacity protein-like surface antigen
MSLLSRILRGALFGVAAATPVFAQTTDGQIQVHGSTSEFEKRSSGNISFIQTRPTGDFSRNIGFGYGMNFAYQFRLDDIGALSLRADGGFAVYGSENFRAPLSSTIGGRITVKVNTNNSLVPLSIGPQLTWPRGFIRPYVNAGIGTQLFITHSSVEGSGADLDFANTTNQSDWTSALVAGGGVYMPIYEGRTKVQIDLGAQYRKGGRAQYLRPGSIEDLPNAQIRVTPMESDTRMVVVRLGVRVGL